MQNSESVASAGATGKTKLKHSVISWNEENITCNDLTVHDKPFTNERIYSSVGRQLKTYKAAEFGKQILAK